MLVSLLVVGLVYSQVVRKVQTSSIENRLLMLENTSTVLDAYFISLEEIATQISHNPVLMGYLFKERLRAGSADVWPLIRAHKNLRAYTMTIPFRETFYIFFRQSEMVMSRQSIHYGFEHHYQYVLSLPDVPIEEWHAMLFGQPRTGDYARLSASVNLRDPERVLTYIHTIPAHSHVVGGSIVVLIRESRIEEMLRQLIGPNDGWAYIVNGAGQIVTSVSGSGEREIPHLDVLNLASLSSRGQMSSILVDGEPTLKMVYASQHSDWHYVVAAPERVFMEPVRRVQEIVALMALLAVTVGVSLSWYLAYRNAQPLREIVTLLKSAGGLSTASNYDVMKRSVRELVESNKKLMSLADEQSRALEASMIHRLLRGDYADPGEISELSSFTDLRLGGTRLVALLLAIETAGDRTHGGRSEEIHLARAIAEKALRGLLKDSGVLLVLKPIEIVVVMSLSGGSRDEDRQEVQVLADSAVRLMRDEVGINVSVGIGGFVRRAIDLQDSFKQAEQALHACAHSHENILWHGDISGHSKFFTYPVELETRLMGYTVAGNRGEVTRLLRRLYDSNLGDESKSENDGRYFLRQLAGTVYRIGRDHEHLAVAAEALPTAFDDTMGEVDWFSHIEAAFEMMCRLAEEHRTNRMNRLIRDIEEYLLNNFHRPELTVVEVAEHFDLSPSYFPQFFKEQTGSSFRTYLERIRIDNACDILEQRNGDTMEAVAGAIGYYSVRSFRRAFKRTKGIPPAQYFRSA